MLARAASEVMSKQFESQTEALLRGEKNYFQFFNPYYSATY